MIILKQFQFLIYLNVLYELKTPEILYVNFAMSNFAMGTILGKGFAQAQVHTNHSTSAEGTCTMVK